MEPLAVRHGEEPPVDRSAVWPVGELGVDPPPRSYKEQDAGGLWGCKTVGCEGRSRACRGRLAYLCEECRAPLQARHGAEVRAGHARARRDPVPPVVRQVVELQRGWIRVPDTGLVYRSPAEAYVAADEIEADGERVAGDARFDGNEGKAEQAIDAARELAERIRSAARAAEAPRADPPALEAVEATPPPLGPALRALVRAARDVLDALERELEVESSVDAGTVARIAVRRIAES